MISLKDLTTSKVSLTKNLVSDQTLYDITCKLNTAGEVFDSNGLGTGAASTSSFWLIHCGGFSDQKLTISMKYVSPTAQAASQIGAILRCKSFDTIGAGPTSYQDYYWARVQNGVARITKSIAGTLTNLTSSAWALPQGQYATITFQVVGSALSATFHDESSTLTDVVLSTTDSSITTGGLMGFRSLSSSIAVQSFTAEQL